MSSYICPICRDSLTNPTIAPDKTFADYHPVATNCGHMFHLHCTAFWTNYRLTHQLPVSCACCYTPLGDPAFVRLHPNEDGKFENYLSLVQRDEEYSQKITEIEDQMKAIKLNIAEVQQTMAASSEKITEQNEVIHQMKDLLDYRLEAVAKLRESDPLENDLESLRVLCENTEKSINEKNNILNEAAIMIKSVELVLTTAAAPSTNKDGVDKEDAHQDSIEEKPPVFFANADKSLEKIKDILGVPSDWEDDVESLEMGGEAAVTPIAIQTTTIARELSNEEEELIAVYVQAIDPYVEESNVDKEVILYIPRGKSVIPSLEIFYLQLSTFLRFRGIAYRHEIIDKDAVRVPVLKIGQHNIYEPDLCWEIIKKLFPSKENSRGDLEDDNLSNKSFLATVLNRDVFWGILLWQWVYNEGKCMTIVTEECPKKLRAAIKLEVEKRAREVFDSLDSEQVIGIVVQYIHKLSDELHGRDFFSGTRPGEVDCCAFIILAQILWNTENVYFTSAVYYNTNLHGFVKRMKHLFWPEWVYGAELPGLWI